MTNIKEKEHTKDFESSLISEFTKEVLKEQRRNRRWGIFFKFIFIVYISGFLLMYLMKILVLLISQIKNIQR